MEPANIIESYVADVVRRLPRRQRNDVGFELRSLLTEELAGRAAEAGRPADEALALDMLTAFGRPQEVADRYRPAGFTVLRPADAPAFAAWALGGVALQWAITLPAVFLAPASASGWTAQADSWLGRIAGWWLGWGIGAFWWPGFLISLTLIAAMLGHRTAESRPWAPPRIVDRDHVNRLGLITALGFWLPGATLMTALPWLGVWAPGLPQPLIAALAFDPLFVVERALPAPLLWSGGFALLASVLIAGRWSRNTRRIEAALNVAWAVLLTWWVAGGPIFRSAAADETAKLCLLGVILIVLIDLALGFRRWSNRLRPPPTAGVQIT